MELPSRKVIVLIITMLVVVVLIATTSRLYGYVKTSLSSINSQENEVFYGASVYILQNNKIYEYEDGKWWYKEKGAKLYKKADSLEGLDLNEGIEKLKKNGEIEIYKDEDLTIPISMEEAKSIASNSQNLTKIDIQAVKKKLISLGLYNYIIQTSNQNGIDPNLVIAIIAQESGNKIIKGEIENIKGDLNKNNNKYQAFGIMQFWPTQAGADVCKYYSSKFETGCPCQDPEKLLYNQKIDIYCGILYLKICQDIYHKKTIHDLAECYNGGPTTSNEKTQRYSANVEYYYNKLKA